MLNFNHRSCNKRKNKTGQRHLCAWKEFIRVECVPSKRRYCKLSSPAGCVGSPVCTHEWPWRVAWYGRTKIECARTATCIYITIPITAPTIQCSSVNNQSCLLSEIMDVESVCLFGIHKSKPDRCALYTFDTNRKETLIAETEFRHHNAIACLNGA